MNNSSSNIDKTRHKSVHGFTLIEIMISIVILMVGLLSLLAVFSMAMASTQTSQQDLLAKQIAQQEMESIFTARDTAALTFTQIQNSPAGVFLTGPQTIRDASNGVPGTGSDIAPSAPCPGPAKCIILSGTDGILGTADDVYQPLSNFTRTVAITALTDASGNTYSSLRQVTVKVQYRAVNVQKQYVITSFISSNR